MIITHASQSKINEIDSSYSEAQLGCLFFASEGNEYNLAAECNFQYNLDVENILEMRRLNYQHDFSECEIMRDVFDDVRCALGLDCDDEEISEILDDTNSVFDYETSIDSGVASWLVQQFQGILAHKLGYDCAESNDERGVVYIAFCVDRKLEEIALNGI